MPSSNDDQPPIEALHLEPVFDENQLGLPAAQTAGAENTVPIADLAVLDVPPDIASALPVCDDLALRPRLLFADDDEVVLESLLGSARTYFERSVDIRTWSPGGDGLVDAIAAHRSAGWEPDLLVLDINFDDGGHAGLDYLQQVRGEPGLLAMPVVLATGNQLVDLEQDRTSPHQGSNKTGIAPRLWAEKAKSFEPEAVLYGKQGSTGFIARLVENLPVWRQLARRRAWARLLADVAEMLDGPPPALTDVGAAIAGFAHRELGVTQAFVTWLQSSGRLKLIGLQSDWPNAKLGRELDPGKVELLQQIVQGQRGALTCISSVTSQQSGALDDVLAGSQLLAANAVLDKRSVGVIVLLRPAIAPRFDESVDGTPVALLARFLAAALGRSDAISRLQSRERKLLEFAQQLADAADDKSICRQLAELVHDTLHGDDNDGCEVTVRLVKFDTGEIDREAAVGMATRNPELHLWADDSVIVSTVRDGQPRRFDDIQPQVRAGKAIDSGTPLGNLRSELCIPLISGRSAIGAINAESTLLGRYREADEKFVQSAGALAVSAIQRNHSRLFMERVAAFATSFAEKNAGELNSDLRDILKQFSSASAIVRLRAPESGSTGSAGMTSTAPWRVHDVEVLLDVPNRLAFSSLLRRAYENDWDKTSVAAWVKKATWVEGWCQHVDKSEHPVLRTRLASSELGDLAEGTAILWQRSDPHKPPDEAIVLLWLFNPPITDAEVKQLGLLAELLSSLKQRQSALRTYQKTAIEGEQAALLGYVTQHLRHRLRGDQNKLTGLAQWMRQTPPEHAAAQLPEFARLLEIPAESLVRGFRKSLSFIKAPNPTKFDLRHVIDSTVVELKPQLGSTQVSILLPEMQEVWGDADITGLALFTLLENSIDALRDELLPKITMRLYSLDSNMDLLIEDNGPGVEPGIREKLFQLGVTTKGARGLGSGLAFARARLRAAGSDLLLNEPVDSSRGASFTVRFAKNGAQSHPQSPLGAFGAVG